MLMTIKLNNTNISDIQLLKNFVKNASSEFEIEIIQNDNEWLQISCENNVIAVAVKDKFKIHYYNNLKENRLYDVIYSYYSNPAEFKIKDTFLNVRLNHQSSKKSFVNLFFAFLISCFLLILHSVFIVMNSTKSGTVFEKILDYYFNASITPYQKSLPICVIIFFIFSIIYGIKFLMEKSIRNKKKNLRKKLK